MNSLLKVFFAGLFISLVGAMPLGVLNITASNIAATEGIRAALLFSLGVLLVEVLYVRLTLTGMELLAQNKKRYDRIHTVTSMLLLVLGMIIIYRAFTRTENTLSETQSHLPVFLWGILLSAINPAQIPFWIGWNTILFDRGLLKRESRFFNVYVTGIGTGTLLGLILFISGATFLADWIKSSQLLINLVIGSIFLLMGAKRFYSVLKKQAASD